MSIEPGKETAPLDARLARLPQWQPPADFAVRLAAAAARQADQPVEQPPTTRAWLRGAVLRRLPLALGAGLLALVLAIIPWSTVASSPALPWLVACSAAIFGLVLTMRLLRSP